MSSLYGYVPNSVQQHLPQKPEPVDVSPTKPTDITPETAPTIATKVAPSFEANTSTMTSDSRKNADTQLTSDDPKLSAESKVVANDQSRPALTSADLAEARAKDLEIAREHALEYRAYKARLENSAATSNAHLDETGSEQQKMDVRIPFPDEIPDRPLPRFGVPEV